MAIIHQGLALSVRERCAERFAHDFQRLIGHPDHMKLVHDDTGLGQTEVGSGPVRRPHIDADHTDLFPPGQCPQIRRHHDLGARGEQVKDASFLEVGQNAAGFTCQRQIVDAQPGGRDAHHFEGRQIIVEDVADGFLIQHDLGSDTDEGAPQCLTVDVLDQPCRHPASIIPIWHRLPERLATLGAAVALLMDQEGDLLPGHEKVLVLAAKAVECGFLMPLRTQRETRRGTGKLVAFRRAWGLPPRSVHHSRASVHEHGDLDS